VVARANEPGADRVHRETVHPSRKRATQSVIYQRDRRGFLGSAGCQPAVSGSLPETVVFRCSTNVNRGAAAGCRGQQAGSLRSPDKKILPRRTRDARDAFDQSQRPQESNEAASVQTPDLVSPRTTTMTSRPGREPLAIRQWPAASVYPVFIPLQKGSRFRTLLVFSSSRVRPLA